MFTPSDCHYIEFNYYPDDPKYELGTVQVRQPTLNAAWTKGGTGNYYVLQANNRTNKQAPHFYDAGWMKISIRDAAHMIRLVSSHIPGGGILKFNDFNASVYPHFLQSDLNVPYRKHKVRKRDENSTALERYGNCCDSSVCTQYFLNRKDRRPLRSNQRNSAKGTSMHGTRSSMRRERVSA